tara:strand:- start:1468 stop:2064 length:597 start_codon:yes stop_codon:yes gene_type:complete
MYNITLEEQTTILSQYLPNNDLVEAAAIEGSNLRALLKGISVEFLLIRAKIEDLRKNMFPSLCDTLISNHERDYGIPDDIFSGEGTLEERRNNLLFKVASTGISTEEDFKALASMFGVEVNITNGWDRGSFPIKFPLIFGTPKSLKHTIILDFKDQKIEGSFPLAFPLEFSTNKVDILIKLFNKVKPANCIVYVVSNV